MDAGARATQEQLPAGQSILSQAASISFFLHYPSLSANGNKQLLDQLTLFFPDFTQLLIINKLLSRPVSEFLLALNRGAE
ncbi:hypothetical protein NX722_26590 [Endozoicomonas gorgoniicola]|uniref:Uncharacterized protein n=1 Tax=Endozoicomonas gorgoniicola TaxID=1234144 RepID=A0ABT3N3E2_9GAMM|nr:hypothetical protein [Endozoicomonas gorgoniicola]MCW7556131.1 hypothetical protein [Endozoicomonas gorgoniicola]